MSRDTTSLSQLVYHTRDTEPPPFGAMRSWFTPGFATGFRVNIPSSRSKAIAALF